jgi:phosphoribosylformylglycinamidine synthase
LGLLQQYKDSLKTVEAEEIFERWDLHAENIGTISQDGFVHIQYQGQDVAEVPARALAEEAPVYQRPLQDPNIKYPEFRGDLPRDYNEIARRILVDSSSAATRVQFIVSVDR